MANVVLQFRFHGLYMKLAETLTSSTKMLAAF
jgi:hypothetical protein